MKNLFVFSVFIVAACTVSAKNYYVAANGSDANTGLTTSSPWKSITKLNASFSVIAAGDSILFRSGDTFFGAIVIGKSGASTKPIVISSYGTGAKPVITGFVTASSWVSVSTGVYQAYIPGAKSTLNMVAMNNIPQALGRYPNADAANGGYLNYESFSGSTSITDNQLTTATNWVGAEAVVRKKLWVLDRCKITAHSGGILTFTNTNGSTYDGNNGYGYFIQNDIRTLDQLGEWYFKNSTKYLQMNFGTAAPSSYTVKVSCIDTLLIMSSKTYINISNLVFEGANENALYGVSGNYINIQNCDFINAGVGGINITTTSNLLIENCTTNNILSGAICATNPKASNITIRGCTVKNTGTLPGMGLSNGNSYKAVTASALSNLLVEYNKVDTSGYVGIDWQGSDVNIRYNVVNYFDFIKDDAGGIYTYSSGTDASPGTLYTNRVVSNNIVMNGIGAPYGRNSATLFVSGIYLDGRPMNVSVLNNTVFNNGKNGIHANNPQNITISGNTSYNNLNAVSCARWSILGNITNLSIKKNILYPKYETQRCLYYVNTGLNEPATTTTNTAIRTFGIIDSNTYSMINPSGFNFEIYGTTGGALVATSPYSLEGWQANTVHDMNGRKTAKLPIGYKITGLVGSNKFTNGLFTSSVSGLSVYGTGTTGTWDNTGKINGGSLKLTLSSPAANKYSSLLSSIGAVSSSKKYMLRFSTYGTTSQGIVRAYLRKTASPYTTLVPVQTKSFGVGRKDHEFLFTAPTTEAAASFVIEIEQFSGTVYFDNVDMYEATATLYDIESQLRFEYNTTKLVKTINLDASYTGVDGTVYTGTVSLQPFTSIILVKDTGTTTPPPASTELKVTASAAAINCYGSNTTVSVNASSGTAPYTGTGTFTANAGKGSVKLAFPTSVAGAYTLMYYTVGAISSFKNYVLRFSTLGTTANGKLRTSLRQTSSPWSTFTDKQTATFGTGRTDHEFIFRAPPSQTAASFLIEVEQASGTTYIDNIAFFESDSNSVLKSANLYTDGQLEAGIGRLFFYSYNNNQTASWDTTAKISSTYYYAVTDAANGIAVVPVIITQPSAIIVTATAGTISVLGGTTSVVVSATGGTAPYTGAGTFTSLVAGTYTYTVTDAKGCSAGTTVTVLPFVSARPATNIAARVASPGTADVVSNTIELSAYPNPFSSTINLRLTGGTSEKVLISVYSFDSKLVYQTTGNSNSSYTFGSNLLTGVYVVKVTQGNNIQTVKLVKTTN